MSFHTGSRRSQPPLALSVPLSRFTPRVGGGSAFFVRLLMRAAHIIILVASLCCCIRADADTKLDFWHSYTHTQTQQIHYGFNLTNSKHGLFWGPCGPSIESIQ